MNSENQPPLAPRIEHREVRHGETVTDDYYWLREKSNPEVHRYLEAENAYTEAMTRGLKPFEDKLYAEMLARIKQTDLSVPYRMREYLYYTRTEEGKQYVIYCRRKDETGAAEEVLLDLNELAVGQKFVAVEVFAMSDDQDRLAYTIDYAGFRQYQLRVKGLPDTFERVTSVEWAADNRTLFLTTEDEVTKRSDKLWRHVAGTDRFDLLYEEQDELYDIHLEKSRDRRFLFLSIESTDTTEVHYLRADAPAESFALFREREKKHRYYLDYREGVFYIRTNKSGKNFAIMTAPDRASEWSTFVAHREDVLIDEIELFKTFAVCIEKANAAEQMRVYEFASDTWTAIPFSEPVYSVQAESTPDYESTRYRYRYQSFVTPRTVFDFDVAKRSSKLLKREEVLGGYDPSQYVSERLWAAARDGARVPISIVYRKGFKRDGRSPLLLYAYGSYGIAMPVAFDSTRFSLLDRDMAYAIAHIRGGNELGERWREDGMLLKKKNTFYDFIDSAEYLIREKWTSRERLLIEGRSAGGLLVGAVVNMRPDLFRAVHAAVPFVDVMNTMMDASLPLTVGEYLEWGDPNDKSFYEYMKSYSPYDNLAARDYPAMLVTTSLQDSQVMYWEPAKYVAKRRAMKSDDNVLLLKTRMQPAGHGGASGRYDRLRDRAFEYAWLLSQVGITS